MHTTTTRRDAVLGLLSCLAASVLAGLTAATMLVALVLAMTTA